MENSNLFEVKIVTPGRSFFDGEASMVEFNTTEGELGIMKGHIPMTLIIEPGTLTITSPEGSKTAALHSGFAVVDTDSVTILAEIIEWSEEIDRDRAERALERAKTRLSEKATDTDIDRATVALKKAICRINSIK